jgi:FKBP-type peptidyl-prolyl cis-trans isomerase
MKNSIIYLMVVGLLIAATSCQQGGSADVSVETKVDSVSYALGYSIGSNIIKQFPDVDPAIVAAAVNDVYAEKEITMFADEQAAGTFIQTYVQAAMVTKGQDNLEVGNAFLETNKAREGITVTESGLQYEVLTAGTGAKPAAADQVRVHYHGTLIDGTVFDSSVDRGEPATFGVGQVIPGWTEALQLMPTGSKWKVYLPSNIAYGERGAGGDIGPNAALIFEVELLEIIAK